MAALAPKIVLLPDGTETYDLAAWEEQLLAEHLRVGTLRIAAAKACGIWVIETPADRPTKYVDRQGRERLQNIQTYEWQIRSEFCSDCGASKTHVKSHGHYVGCRA